MKTNAKMSRTLLFVLGVGLVALMVRFSVIGKGLPYTYYPDEPDYVASFQRMFLTQDANPRMFYYPSMLFTLNALAYIPYYTVGRLTGLMHAASDIKGASVVLMGVGYTPLPSSFLMGRGLTALFGVGAVVMLVVLGRSLTSDWRIGTLAGLILALSPTHVEYSRYIFPHVILSFFLLLAFWLSVRVFRKGRWRDYILAGIGSGLAMSTMYHGGVIALALVAAHFFRTGLNGWRDIRLWSGLAAFGSTFVILNPFMLLDSAAFFKDSTFILSHYLFAVGGRSAGGMDNTLSYYLVYSWNVEGVTLLLAAIELVISIWRRDKLSLLVFVFSVPYFAAISMATARNSRTFLPLIPFLALSAAQLVWLTVDQVRHKVQDGYRRNVAVGGIATILITVLVIPMIRTLQDTFKLAQVDSRETARVWIAKNLPPGSKVALEAYSPYVDPAVYDIEAIVRLSDQPVDWYKANDVDFLVFSRGMFGRFFAEPDLYVTEVARYDALFETFREVKTFEDGGYEIRIYATDR